jgi:hypothetical protein
MEEKIYILIAGRVKVEVSETVPGPVVVVEVGPLVVVGPVVLS